MTSPTPSYHLIHTMLSSLEQKLMTACQQLGMTLSRHQCRQLLGYLDGLLLWNKAYNLTAITQVDDALTKHIIDCLAVLPVFGRYATADIHTVLDIGTGAGLPAVVLAIMHPEWQISAVDSNNKKIRFIRQMASELKLDNLHPIASRIEQYHSHLHHHSQHSHFDGYDVITSRAFASLADFVAVATPYLSHAGVLCAMKGKPPTAEELSQLPTWQVWVDKLTVPFLDEERCLVQLRAGVLSP